MRRLALSSAWACGKIRKVAPDAGCALVADGAVRRVYGALNARRLRALHCAGAMQRYRRVAALPTRRSASCRSGFSRDIGAGSALIAEDIWRG
jgi:hypothetical protein